MTNLNYDYIIVGAGAAGLQLALVMNQDPFFAKHNILILEKQDKQVNDKRWSFWEKGTGQWDDLVYKSWSTSRFYGPLNKELFFDLNPYAYKSLQSIDFYTFAQKEISKSKNMSWLTGDVSQIIQKDGSVVVSTSEKEYSCSHCFDSRITLDWNKEKKKHVTLWQHFKGWTIEFENETFNPNEFVMMDFRHRHHDSTSFIYVLPINKSQALIEFTLFTKDVFKSSEEYDPYLKNYISKYISSDHYSIIDIEEGRIPMTNFPFHKDNQKNITKIGTAGSWVRPSTGYSFKYIEKYVSQIIQNIKSNKRIDHHLLSRKTRWLDSVLLEVLHNENHLGPSIFESQYSKNSMEQIFKFLDGETSIVEDIKMISKFEKLPFLKGALRHLFR